MNDDVPWDFEGEEAPRTVVLIFGLTILLAVVVVALLCCVRWWHARRRRRGYRALGDGQPANEAGTPRPTSRGSVFVDVDMDSDE